MDMTSLFKSFQDILTQLGLEVVYREEFTDSAGRKGQEPKSKIGVILAIMRGRAFAVTIIFRSMRRGRRKPMLNWQVQALYHFQKAWRWVNPVHPPKSLGAVTGDTWSAWYDCDDRTDTKTRFARHFLTMLEASDESKVAYAGDVIANILRQVRGELAKTLPEYAVPYVVPDHSDLAKPFDADRWLAADIKATFWRRAKAIMSASMVSAEQVGLPFKLFY